MIPKQVKNEKKFQELRAGIILADKTHKKVTTIKTTLLALASDSDLRKLQATLRANNGIPVYKASETALQTLENNINSLLHALSNARIILTQQAKHHE